MLRRLKASSVVFIILFAIPVVFALLFYLGKVRPGTEGTTMEEPLITDEFLIMSYVYFGAALLVTVVFMIREVIRHVRSARGILTALAVLTVLTVLCYLWASRELIPGFTNASNVEQTVKLVDTGLKMAYVLGAAAVAGVLYTEIKAMIRKSNP